MSRVVCQYNPPADIAAPLRDDVENTLEVQASSIGWLTTDWYSQFLSHALQPNTSTPATQQAAAVSSLFDRMTAASQRNHDVSKLAAIYIVYPTEQQARALLQASVPNVIGLSQVVMSESPHRPNPTAHFARCVPRRSMPLHSKVIVRQWRKSDGSVHGWTYAGSHNFSKSAWGRRTKSGNKLDIRNCELGVVLPSPNAFVDERLPYCRPLQRYTAEDRYWSQQNASQSTRILFNTTLQALMN